MNGLFHQPLSFHQSPVSFIRPSSVISDNQRQSFYNFNKYCKDVNGEGHMTIDTATGEGKWLYMDGSHSSGITCTRIVKLNANSPGELQFAPEVAENNITTENYNQIRDSTDWDDRMFIYMVDFEQGMSCVSIVCVINLYAMILFILYGLHGYTI